MTALEALKAYLALSPSQKQLLKSKRLENDLPPDDWLELLGGLARYDQYGDKLRKVSGIGFFVLGAFNLFFYIVAVNVNSVVTDLLMWLVFVLWIASGVAWLLTRRADLSNHLRLFIVPLVTLLGDDIKPGGTLHLKMDLRGGTVKDKLTEKKEPYKRGRYHRIVESVFVDPWLTADTVLSDGSHLHMDLSDGLRQFKKTKRNARGKIKSKTKYKIKGLLDVQLKLPAGRYHLGKLPQSNNRQLRLSSKPGDKWIALRARRVVLRQGQDLQAPALPPLLEILTTLYGGADSNATGSSAHV